MEKLGQQQQLSTDKPLLKKIISVSSQYDLTHMRGQIQIQYGQEFEEIFKEIEKIKTKIYPTSTEASLEVANMIKDGIQAKQKEGKPFVLGLATGSTPLEIYKQLIVLCNRGELSFKNVITFNLDEYYYMLPESLQSYHLFMQENLFKHIDIPKENINIPRGDLKFEDIDSFCEDYENKIAQCGGIDFQILGIGETGHIGFNEPGSSLNSTTRLIYLDKITMTAAASDFFGVDNVPRKAITMGIKTIMAAKQIVILAFSENKSRVVKSSIEGPITKDLPASYLQNHNNVKFILDYSASDQLTRIKCPWILKSVNKLVQFEFDHALTKKAVLWLSQECSKPISKLVKEDYDKNGLYQLADLYDDINVLNQQVMEQIRNTVTVYPIGIQQKKVLIFSPHPDDDVICMAGTMRKLVQQGHTVYVAYQTSGNVGVFDHDAQRFANFATLYAQTFNLQGMAQECLKIEQTVNSSIANKKVANVDSQQTLAIKGLIRKTEAIAASKSCGVLEGNIFFLDLPFYQTGTVKKNSVTQKDIEICKDLILQLQPDVIFAAGDLSDPHGTHRGCLYAVLAAHKSLNPKENKRSSSKNQESAKDGLSQTNSPCDSPYSPLAQQQQIIGSKIYLYRGAWQEWGIDMVTLAVPLHPNEVYLKRLAVFKHQSQKDRALYPGLDSREFWQRSEIRNKQTAEKYRMLGLAEYEAMEVFVDYNDVKKLIKI